jgi:hypothetical protein
VAGLSLDLHRHGAFDVKPRWPLDEIGTAA